MTTSQRNIHPNFAVGLLSSAAMAVCAGTQGLVAPAVIFALANAPTKAMAQVGAPVITSPLTVSGKVGVPFSYQITATNSPTLYQSSTYVNGQWVMAPGISEGNANTGLFWGTPTTAGSFAINLWTKNAQGSSTAVLILNVAAAGAPSPSPAPAPPPATTGAPVITSPLTASGKVGVPFSYQITATNSPTLYQSASYVNGQWVMAPGISEGNANTGLFWGTPTTAGSFAINLWTKNAQGSSTAVLILNVAAAGAASPSPSPAPAPAPVPSPAPAPTPSASNAKPRVAAVYFGDVGTTATQQEVAKFDFVLTNLYGSKSEMQGVINTMRQVNPTMKLGSYTNMTELRPYTNDPVMGAALNAVNANNWWVRNAYGQLVQYTPEYGTYLVNLTAWATRDAYGRSWPQVYAALQVNGKISQLTGLDYVYVDNVWRQARANADYKRNGTDQLSTDPEVATAYRQGMASYFAALRSLSPTVKIFGNSDNDLSSPEFQGQLEGSFLECGLGKSWSFETWGGWTRMMSEYRKMLANTRAPKDVVLQGCGSYGQVDLNVLRYGLASALLEDGWFTYTATEGAGSPFRADEYNAGLGTAAESPPTAATASGIWMRRYTNGMVLVNPGSTTASINIGSGYKRLYGAQDPVTNNGQAVSTVTLLPRQGLVLVRQ